MTPILTITLPDVCPPSWNKFYAGMHWAARKQLADDAHVLIRASLPDALISDIPGPFESRLRERGNLIIALGGPDKRRS